VGGFFYICLKKMKNFNFLVLFLFVPFIFSCQDFPDYAGNFNRTITVDELERNYIIHLPLGYHQNTDNLYPLVLVLHGGGGNDSKIMRETDFNKVANDENFIVVYPDGLNNSWADARNASESSIQNIDDVNFIRTLIDTISSNYNIDQARIYVTGISNGGFMTQTLLCALPDVFAAGASVVATLPQNLKDSVPQSKISVMFIVGDSDPLVPFEGGEMIKPSSGGFILSAFESVMLWAKQNSCDTIPIEADMPDLYDDETTVTLFDYENGNKSVQMYVVNNGGHGWPGGSQYLPKSVIGIRTKDIDATEVIWQFFKDNSK